jgi:hypothetical protein
MCDLLIGPYKVLAWMLRGLLIYFFDGRITSAAGGSHDSMTNCVVYM